MKCWLFFFFYLQPRNKPADLEASVSWWRWPIIFFFFSTENNRTIPVSFSASHAFHNGFGEWSKKISSPFVGTAAGPFNGRHFFSGKIPFLLFWAAFRSEKRYRWSFYWGKKGPNLNPFDSISQVSINFESAAIGRNRRPRSTTWQCLEQIWFQAFLGLFLKNLLTDFNKCAQLSHWTLKFFIFFFTLWDTWTTNSWPRRLHFKIIKIIKHAILIEFTVAVLGTKYRVKLMLK